MVWYGLQGLCHESGETMGPWHHCRQWMSRPMRLPVQFQPGRCRAGTYVLGRNHSSEAAAPVALIRSVDTSELQGQRTLRPPIISQCLFDPLEGFDIRVENLASHLLCAECQP